MTGALRGPRRQAARRLRSPSRRSASTRARRTGARASHFRCWCVRCRSHRGRAGGARAFSPPIDRRCAFDRSLKSAVTGLRVVHARGRSARFRRRRAGTLVARLLSPARCAHRDARRGALLCGGDAEPVNCRVRPRGAARGAPRARLRRSPKAPRHEHRPRHPVPFPRRRAQPRAIAWIARNGYTLAAITATPTAKRLPRASVVMRRHLLALARRVRRRARTRVAGAAFDARSRGARAGQALKALWLNDAGAVRGAGVVRAPRRGRRFLLAASAPDRDWIRRGRVCSVSARDVARSRAASR